MVKKQANNLAPARPLIGFSLGVTGHREANLAFATNRGEIEGVFDEILEAINAAVKQVRVTAHFGTNTPIRLHSLLVDGFDQIAARQAIERGWEVVAPLPFGRALNTAINANPVDENEARALIIGRGICSEATQERAVGISDLMSQAKCFELADQDATISALFLDKLSAPQDLAKAQAYSFAASERVALAAQVMIEQSDLIIGVWDGAATSFTGGTGHTIALALTLGTPVIWINARAPQAWKIFYALEELPSRDVGVSDTLERDTALARIIGDAMHAPPYIPRGTKSSHLEGMAALNEGKWHSSSEPVWHAYRRIEALFGGLAMKDRFNSLRQTYEAPSQIATGSAKRDLESARALPAQCADFVAKIEGDIYMRFAWADGISSRLSDTYRGGMVLNFIFSAFAIVGGMAYLPFASGQEKWIFALFELALLGAILTITFVGQKRRWHGRWFETRRVAEYLRHAPILLLMGVGRPAGRWPKGTQTSWPEYYVRHALRSIGLPRIAITAEYLHAALSNILLPYVNGQILYHRHKAKRLSRVHHQLDQLSELLFKLAVASVSAYLLLKLGGIAHLIDKDVTSQLSKVFTFLGVLFPTFGGAIAGIRYFGDFERFSAISDVTVKRLEAVATRIGLLLKAPLHTLTYAHAAELAHATDDSVIAEIGSWQAVFSGKHMTVPV